MIGQDDVIYKNRYVWNRYKNDLNQRKHHLSFELASLAVTGLINNALVTVSVVYRGDLIRIFSARNASPTEVVDYYEQFQEYLD